MPKCGSQCFLCDLPVRFDTYSGCSHGCQYCFAKKFVDISKIEKDETVESLKRYMAGSRNHETRWVDWPIPIHWGGMSDPFQPCEATRKISYECLKLFAETGYPFVVSTKGKLVIEPEYLDLLEKCNCVVQVSVVCGKYDKLELGAPTFKERLHMVEVLSKRVKRVIVRVQPYMHEVFDDVYNNLESFKEAGAYGVIIEGMKFKKKKPGLVKIGGDYCYPYRVIKNDFIKLKDRAHELGLKIYAGENRIRALGDSLTCCGVDGLEGFEPNTFNLNHLLNGDKVEPREGMLKERTGGPFAAFNMTALGSQRTRANSFAFNMMDTYKTKKDVINDILGISKK